MASVTHGKCYLWQRYYGKCNYGKDTMANETEPYFNMRKTVYLQKNMKMKLLCEQKL